MKPNLTFEKQSDVGEEIIINAIKKRAKKKEWITIGGLKNWIRKCNHCKNIVFQKSYSTYSEAVLKNKKCERCRQNGKNNSFYGKKFSEIQINKWKKHRAGKGNPMFGTLGGMFGKTLSKKSRELISKAVSSYWKRNGHNPKGFKKYRNKVDAITKRQPIHLLENCEKRGRAGQVGAFHLDHIKSVWYGYHHKIRPEIIADISNLQFIPWLENQKKWYK